MDKDTYERPKVDFFSVFEGNPGKFAMLRGKSLILLVFDPYFEFMKVIAL